MLSLPPDQLQIDKFVQFQLNQPGFLMRTMRLAKLIWIVSVGDSFAIKDAIINVKVT